MLNQLIVMGHTHPYNVGTKLIVSTKENPTYRKHNGFGDMISIINNIICQEYTPCEILCSGIHTAHKDFLPLTGKSPKDIIIKNNTPVWDGFVKKSWNN